MFYSKTFSFALCLFSSISTAFAGLGDDDQDPLGTKSPSTQALGTSSPSNFRTKDYQPNDHQSDKKGIFDQDSRGTTFKTTSPSPAKRGRTSKGEELQEEKREADPESSPSISLSVSQLQKGELTSPQEEPYISPDYLETERLTLRRVRSAQSDIDSYKVLFADDGYNTTWFTKFTLYEKPEDRIEFLQQREKLGYYQLPLSFSHYNIHSKDDNTLIGRFCFIEQGKEDSVETGIYLVKSSRKKGYGREVLKGILEGIITPALGKPFCTDNTRPVDPKYEILSKDDFQLAYHSTFRGVVAKCDTFHNYGSLAIHERIGFGIKWVNHKPWMFYPPSQDTFLDQEAATSLLGITKIFSMVADGFSKAFKMQYPDEEMNQLFLGDILPLLNSDDFEEEADHISDNLETLFQTDELHTLISALDLWISLEVDPDELYDLVAAQNANRLLSFSVSPKSPYFQSAQLIARYKGLITTLATPKKD
jgi:RimJ/RimL family protein N-acetyltransferase